MTQPRPASTVDRLLLSVALLTLAVVVIGIVGHAYYESTFPPLTNAQLAQRLVHKYEDDYGWSGFPGHATASCNPTTDRVTRACNVSVIGAVCLTGSTPVRDQLLVKIEGQNYVITRTENIDEGDCPVF